MAWFYSSAVRTLCRALSRLLLWTTPFFRAIGGHIPLALRWRKDHGGTGVEPERSVTPSPVWWFWRVVSFPRCLVSKFVRVLRGRRMGERGNGESSESVPQAPSLPPTLYSDDESDQEDRHRIYSVKTSEGLFTELDNKKPGWNEGGGSGFDGQDFSRVKTTDEFYCDYDSTWETEKCEKDPPQFTLRPKVPKSYKSRRFQNAAKDMQNYRRKYPNRSNMGTGYSPDTPNLDFYLGNKPSLPDGVYISEFHKEWYGSYDQLEYVHTFIQWLFPLPEPGMNYHATPLTEQEIENFCNSNTAKENLLKSYELMLDFYGISLLDSETGEVERANNWRERFYNLDSHTHNNLRITRILKCLGILGFPHYQAPLVRFFLNETLIHGELQNVRESVLNYFLFAVLDKKQRKDLIEFAYKNYKHDDEFVWCPKIIQEMWSKQSESEP